jgi:hypothetical protein
MLAAPGENTVHLLGQAFQADEPLLDVSMLLADTTRVRASSILRLHISRQFLQDNLLQSPKLNAVNFNYAHALFPRFDQCLESPLT